MAYEILFAESVAEHLGHLTAAEERGCWIWVSAACVLGTGRSRRSRILRGRALVRGRAGAAVVQLVADSFASIFAKDAHLDTLFLSDVQEAELQKVCRPFFELSSV